MIISREKRLYFDMMREKRLQMSGRDLATFGVVVGVEGESGWVKGLFIHKVSYRAAGIIEVLGLLHNKILSSIRCPKYTNKKRAPNKAYL